MNRRVLALAAGLWLSLSLVSCGGSSSFKKPPSGLLERVLASQAVTSTNNFGGLVFINGQNDTLARVQEMSAGTNPGLMAISPTRNILAAFDSATNTVYAVDTTRESSLGSIQLPGATSSVVIPTAASVGYAAVPAASVNGYSFVGAVEVMNLAGSGAITTTIAVTNAKTVIANSTGSQLLVFSNDSDSVTVLFPGNAVPPVDTSCASQPNATCRVVTGFDRPVYAVITGSTAYVLNCGPQCGGVQASVMALDLSTLTVTATIPVDAATMAFLSGTNLYVAGTPPTNNACTGQTTAAATCGRLDIVDLNSLTAAPGIVITDGYHDQMDMSVNGQLFIGSRNCTNIGNANNPSGEVRGCLSIFNSTTNAVIVPPDNGDVNGLQSFTSRNVEYAAEGGNLRVYDTTKDVLLLNNDVPNGTIDVVGSVGGVKAIDFF